MMLKSVWHLLSKTECDLAVGSTVQRDCSSASAAVSRGEKLRNSALRRMHEFLNMTTAFEFDSERSITTKFIDCSETSVVLTRSSSSKMSALLFMAQPLGDFSGQV